jgi:hypothetical protein
MVVFFLLVQTIPRTHWFWVEKQTSVISKKPLLFLLSKQGLKCARGNDDDDSNDDNEEEENRSQTTTVVVCYS